MNALIKLVIFVIVIAGLFFAYKKYMANQKPKEPPKQEKTIGDQFREDEKLLRAEPNVTQTAAGKPLKFKELTEEEQVGAEQLFEWAIKCREMARLPGPGYMQGPGYGRMVEACRNIIERYPGSEFDYKARRMLGEVPQNKWQQYSITQEEINWPQK
jgi:hypothetical protein